jgi:putative restriction endonuclease
VSLWAEPSEFHFQVPFEADGDGRPVESHLVDESDLRVRLAAFAFLDEQRKLSLELLDRDVLQRGFMLDGQRVPLVAPNGIFKPRACRLPLSITTVPAKEGQPRPYDDAFGHDGLLRYRYRGNDPNHPDNVGLRETMRGRVPLIYFHGIVEGRYEAEYPVFVVGDTPESLTFTVTVDERRFASLGNVADDSIETDIRRRYITRTVQQRLHQQEFRERVLEAYQRHCAICRLKRQQLLEAAHIVGDRETLGAPIVPNGIALCALHHAAFDAHLIAVRPDYQIEVRRDVLEESDGPMLIHGLQGFHGKPIRVPARQHLRPDAQLLGIRYELFQQASRAAPAALEGKDR